MKRTFLYMVILMALIYSCSKDSDSDGKNNDLILGNWNLKTQYRNTVTGSTGKRDTTIYPAGLQSNEFTKNGKVIITVSTTGGGVKKDTGEYKIDGSNIILEKTDTFKLSKLTASDLQIYKKVINSSTKYTEYWLNYKR